MENGKKDTDVLAKDPAQIPFTLEAKKKYWQVAEKGDYQLRGKDEQIKSLETYKQEKLDELDKILEKEIKERKMS